MATAEEYRAAADRAEAAGQPGEAAELRAYADSLAPVATNATPYLEAAKRAEASGAADDAAELRAYAATLAPAATGPVQTGAPANSTSRIDWSQAPQGASERDALVGMDEAGNRTYRSPTGQVYTRPMVTSVPMTRSLSDVTLGDMGDAAYNLGAGIVGGIAQGIMNPGRALSGEPVTNADVLTTAALIAPGQLAGRAASATGGAARVADALPGPLSAAAVREAPFAPAVRAAVPAAKALTEAEVQALAAKAGRGGMGAVRAQEQLAQEAKVNLTAKAAADRLGIDLPADVFSDNQTVRATAGLTRSKVASEAEGAWRNSVNAVRDRADEIMKEMDGSPDIASVSEKVKSSLQATQAQLKKAADDLYNEVDAAIPQSARVQPDNAVKTLNATITDLGGIEGLSAPERGLFNLVTGKDPVTYARLMREKRAIGAALAKQQSTYGGVDEAMLSRLYGALSDDQMAAVQTIGSEELRAKLRNANQLFAKKKAMEKRIVNAFGQDLDGSIVSKLRASIQQGAKGDIANLNRIIKTIPEDLRKETVATALTALSRSARSSQPGFGLTEFAKTYTGLKANAPVYNQIGKAIGPEGMKMLEDLATVAERVNIANANVLTTGKANQVGFNASGLAGRVLQSTGGQRAARAAGAAGGAVTGGPMGAIAGSEMAAAITAGRADGQLAAGRLFSSPEFTQAAVEAAQGVVTPATKAALVNSRPFQSWARVVKISNPTKWLDGALNVPVTQSSAVSAAQSNSTPYDGLFQRYGGQK